jgi:hypothetical protein
MILQSSGQSLCSGISTTQKLFQERSAVKLIVENDAPSATLSEKQFADSERRLLIRLENYWRSLRQSARGPFFEDFWPSRNPVPWKNCFIAYVGGAGAELAFDHIGGSVAALFKPDRTNLPDIEWLLDTITSRFGEIGNVFKTAQPARGEGRFCRPEGTVVLYRSMLLPFVDAKREPAYMVGAITYRLDQMPLA